MDTWSKGRVVLLGDAGYCPSPASGQGSSLALVGAYVLAAELAAAGGDHRAAFPAYERAMRTFVHRNQAVADTGLGFLLPASRTALAARNAGLRVMLGPARRLGLHGLLVRLDHRIARAANAVALPDHRPLEAARQ